MAKEIIISTKNASTTNNGIFQGWGTSLCWWANRIGYSPVLTKKSAELFYSNKGLNLNIMRYNIGGGDDPTHKHITRTDSMVPGWLYYDKKNDSYYYDYEADKNQINVMAECVKASGSDAFVEVFSNSPPYFMTKSGCSSGGKNPNKNNLRDECYEDFAEYLAHVTEYINNTLKIKVFIWGLISHTYNHFSFKSYIKGRVGGTKRSSYLPLWVIKNLSVYVGKCQKPLGFKGKICYN